MNCPCYNRETHTDCPKRHVGCAVGCPDWATYSAERDKEYEKRAEISKTNFALGRSIDNLVAKKLKRIIENRAYRYMRNK